MTKIVSLEQLRKMRPQLKDVILAGGVFDILHVGHINHLKEAKAAAKTLIVHVTSDARVKEKKGPTRPFQPENERAEIIAALECVDYVFIADVPHYDQSILEILGPDKLYFNIEALSSEIYSYLDAINWTDKLVVSTRDKKHHTSDIVKKIRNT